jgi:hypothetical protein
MRKKKRPRNDAGLMNKRFVARSKRGILLDRNASDSKTKQYVRVDAPNALARFFQPIV